MRLFVALPLPAATEVEVEEALAPHRRAHPGVRWLAPATYHVTLRFLGSCRTGVVGPIADAVASCAAEAGPFAIAVGRGGGTRGRSEVAWLDVLEGRGPIEGLADRLDALLPDEVREAIRTTRPAPHLTIARRASAALLAALPDETLGRVRVEWVADRVVLFRSHTGTPAGSRYEPLATARLGGRVAA